MAKTKNSILIPYMIESLNEDTSFDERDTYLHAVYCKKDDLQLFIKTSKLFGDNEAEPILCPFCNEPAYRGDELSHFVTSHEKPEAIACLKLNDRKILELVIQKSSTEAEMEGIKAILERQDFSNIVKQVKSFQSRKLFQKSLKKFQIKKLISTSNLLPSFSKKLILKRSIEKKCKQKQIKQEKHINRVDRKRPKWTSEHGLESIKKRWTLSQNIIPKSLSDSDREEMKKRWYQMQSLLKGRSTLKKWSKVSLKEEILKCLPYNILNLHHEVDPFRGIKTAI